MKNKKITITTTELDTNNQIMIDCGVISSLGGRSTPQQVFFKNSTGKAIEINFLNKNEIHEYRITSTGTVFIGIGVANGDSFSSKTLFNQDIEYQSETIDYLLIQKSESGTTTAGLVIYCIDYI